MLVFLIVWSADHQVVECLLRIWIPGLLSKPPESRVGWGFRKYVSADTSGEHTDVQEPPRWGRGVSVVALV